MSGAFKDVDWGLFLIPHLDKDDWLHHLAQVRTRLKSIIINY